MFTVLLKLYRDCFWSNKTNNSKTIEIITLLEQTNQNITKINNTIIKQQTKRPRTPFANHFETENENKIENENENDLDFQLTNESENKVIEKLKRNENEDKNNDYFSDNSFSFNLFDSDMNVDLNNPSWLK